MEIRDYILFYVGEQARFFVFDDKAITNGFLERYKNHYPDGVYAPLLTLDNFTQVLNDGYKLVLRRLSDMTEEEANTILQTFGSETKNWMNVKSIWPMHIRYEFTYASSSRKRESIFELDKCKPEVFRHLLAKGFDLFGLIDAGLAIDSATLKTGGN